MEKLTFRKLGKTFEPITYWELSDNTFVAIYQGERGANPELDFIVKYLVPNKRLRMPSHTHWIVDLLIKADNNPDIVRDFVNEWINIYEQLEPFKDKEERRNYKLIFKDKFSNNLKYSIINQYGNFSMEFLSVIIELFVRCEKQTPGAFMFKGLLKLIKNYCEGDRDFYQVVSMSKRV